MCDPTGVMLVKCFQNRHILLRALLSHHKTMIEDFNEYFVESSVAMTLADVKLRYFGTFVYDNFVSRKHAFRDIL